RIKGLSLGSAIKHALLSKRKPKDRKNVVKTLIDTFRYPRLGPGMLWEACARKIREMGVSQVLLDRCVTGCSYDADSGMWSVKATSQNGGVTSFTARHLISSAPLNELIPR